MHTTYPTHAHAHTRVRTEAGKSACSPPFPLSCGHASYVLSSQPLPFGRRASGKHSTQGRTRRSKEPALTKPSASPEFRRSIAHEGGWPSLPGGAQGNPQKCLSSGSRGVWAPSALRRFGKSTENALANGKDRGQLRSGTLDLKGRVAGGAGVAPGPELGGRDRQKTCEVSPALLSAVVPRSCPSGAPCSLSGFKGSGQTDSWGLGRYRPFPRLLTGTQGPSGQKPGVVFLDGTESQLFTSLASESRRREGRLRSVCCEEHSFPGRHWKSRKLGPEYEPRREHGEAHRRERITGQDCSFPRGKEERTKGYRCG